MKFGFSTFFFNKKPIREVIEEMISHNMQTIELSLEIPDMEAIDEDLVARMTSLREDGIGLSIHAPFLEVNSGSNHQEIRRFSRKRTRMAVDTAYEIGCNPVVLHPGYTFWMGKIEDVTERARAYFVRDLKETVSYARKRNVKIALEQVPMPFFFFYDLPQFRNLRQAIPDLGMTLDIGHAYLTKRTKGIDDPEGAIIEDLKEIGVEYVSHVHLHNNKGKRDDHLLDGNINIRRIMRFLEEEGYTGKVIVESHETEHLGIPVVLEKLKELLS
ncbi:MAG: endonuclease IV [Syntrophorhabdus sp. PtaU1.Bin153]|nr:MAG: endonuclease IV [Syntrophorhabdus sp. PtaU1.Bin153]